MDTVFVAVVIILILLVGLVLILLNSLAATAGIRIRADMARLLTSYDRLIDAKSGELHSLQEEIAKRQREKESGPCPPDMSLTENGAPSGPSGIPGSASYRTKALPGGYGVIRDHFRLGPEERTQIVCRVDRLTKGTPRGRGTAAARLRADLSFDTVFRIAQLPSAEQLEILDTTLDDQGWVLLRDFYDEQLGRDFDVTRFYEWLKELCILEADGLAVRCGDRTVSLEEGAEYRDDICEGIQVVSGNLLYDFSLKEREIG